MIFGDRKMKNFIKFLEFLCDNKTLLLVCFLLTTVVELFMALICSTSPALWVLSNLIMAIAMVFIAKWNTTYEENIKQVED